MKVNPNVIWHEFWLYVYTLCSHIWKDVNRQKSGRRYEDWDPKSYAISKSILHSLCYWYWSWELICFSFCWFKIIPDVMFLGTLWLKCNKLKIFSTMLLISFSTLILFLFSTFSTLIFILPDRWHVQGRHGEDNSKVQHEVSPHQQWPVRAHGVQPHVLHSHRPNWSYQRVNLHCTMKCISLPISVWKAFLVGIVIRVGSGN